MESIRDLVREDCGSHELSFAGVHQVEVNVCVLSEFSSRRNVHPGDDVSFLHTLPPLDEDERFVEIGITGVDHRFDAVVEIHGRSVLASDGECHSVAVIGDSFSQGSVENRTQLEVLVDSGDVAVGDGIDGRERADITGRNRLVGNPEIDVRTRMRLCRIGSLVRVTCSDDVQVDDETTGLLPVESGDVRQPLKLAVSLLSWVDVLANSCGGPEQNEPENGQAVD